MPTTRTGRIVYDRPPHLFKLRDIPRISNALFRQTFGDVGLLGQIVYQLSEYFLDAILSLFGMDKFTEVVYYWINGILVKLYGALGLKGYEDLAKKIWQRLSMDIPSDHLAEITGGNRYA